MFKCKQCQSINVMTKAWVLPNKEMKFVDLIGTSESLDNWCNDCEEHVELETVDEVSLIGFDL